MSRFVAVLVLAVTLACGGSPDASPQPDAERLALVVGPDGSSTLRVVAGTATHVFVTVLNAHRRPVVFEAEGLPEFAAFSAEGALTLQPPATRVGEFDFTLRASVGGETVSRDVHLVVERDNRAPVIDRVDLWDPRGFRLGGDVEWDCLLDPYLQLGAHDLDQDPVGLEVVATPVSSPDGSLTLSVPARPPGGDDGTSVEFDRHQGSAVQLTGLAPGVTYQVKVRAIDALGGASGWRDLPSITCVPFGINLPGNNRLGAFARTLLAKPGDTVELLLEAAAPGPVVLTTEKELPDYASLTGTTLSFSTPPFSSPALIDITVVATSGSLQARARIFVELAW